MNLTNDELGKIVGLAGDIGELKGKYEQAKSEIKRLTAMLEEYVRLDRLRQIPHEDSAENRQEKKMSEQNRKWTRPPSKRLRRLTWTT